jgi:hypothetical protein
MALPRSLTQPLRQGQLTVGSGWRAYFAPFNQTLAVGQGSSVLGPTIYDLQVLAKFLDTSDSPVAGWWDCGYVKDFKFTPGSKIGSVVTGYRGAIRAKYRAEVGEKLSFKFAEYSHLSLRIATGTQVFNALASSAPASTTSPLGASGNAAAAMVSYDPAASGGPTLTVTAASGAFVAGDYIVCDQDYDNVAFGFVGDSAANVFQGAVSDVDFIRKTSDYVACVKSVTVSGGSLILVLTGKFMGGGNAPFGTVASVAPSAGAKVQKISGFVSREGGTKIQEWSGIFVLDTVDASQVLMYYPRISPDVFTGMTAVNLQNATSLQTYELEASFDALAFDDPLDGETVIRYSAYYPKPGLNIQY